jgi:hypothetical protein
VAEAMRHLGLRPVRPQRLRRTSNLAAACLAFGFAFTVLMVFAVSHPHLAALTAAGR